MAIKQSLVTGQGESFILEMEYVSKSGEPVDLTGDSVEFQVRKAGSGEEVGFYPAETDALGNISIKVDDEVTETWPVGRCAYKVIHTTSAGDERWLCYGPLTVVSGVDV